MNMEELTTTLSCYEVGREPIHMENILPIERLYSKPEVEKMLEPMKRVEIYIPMPEKKEVIRGEEEIYIEIAKQTRNLELLEKLASQNLQKYYRNFLLSKKAKKFMLYGL